MNKKEVEEKQNFCKIEVTLKIRHRRISTVESTVIIMRERIEKIKQNETEMNIEEELKYIQLFYNCIYLISISILYPSIIYLYIYGENKIKSSDLS